MGRAKASANELTISEARRAIRQIAELTKTYRVADAERRRRMLEANDRGVTAREIAEAIGESRSAVSYWIRSERLAQNERPAAMTGEDRS